jgi:hypothetical protein
MLWFFLVKSILLLLIIFLKCFFLWNPHLGLVKNEAFLHVINLHYSRFQTLLFLAAGSNCLICTIVPRGHDRKTNSDPRLLKGCLCLSQNAKRYCISWIPYLWDERLFILPVEKRLWPLSGYYCCINLRYRTGTVKKTTGLQACSRCVDSVEVYALVNFFQA